MEVPEATSGHLVPLGMFYFYSFSLLLPFPPLGVELHMRLLPALSRPASVAQERVPAAPSPWQDSSRLSGVVNG